MDKETAYKRADELGAGVAVSRRADGRVKE